MQLKLIRCFAIILSLLGTCSAEMPGYYKTVNRVTWLVQDIDKVRPAWVALGLTDIQEYPNITLTGEYHGKPATIYAWEITGHLGNLMVEMIQPAEGQLNAFNDFLMKHGDGIFSIVHEVSSKKEMEKEIKRMDSLGVGVLQQLTTKRQGAPITFTYFDTEPQGKFVLGLVYRPGGASSSAPSSEDARWFRIWVRSFESLNRYQRSGRSLGSLHFVWSMQRLARTSDTATSRCRSRSMLATSTTTSSPMSGLFRQLHHRTSMLTF